jgi:uncharacterized membrane protein (DUF373 family)
MAQRVMTQRKINQDVPVQDQLPAEFGFINKVTIHAMLWLNGVAHVIIGFALGISILMITWLFFLDVRDAADAHNLVHGFLHALGTLMLLWSISALISAEIRYLRGHKLLVETFVEVVLIMFLRKLIVIPVQESSLNFQELLMWMSGVLILGLVYVLVRWADKKNT